MFFLLNILFAFSIRILEGMFGSPGLLGMIYSLSVFIPSLAVAIRRLHDTGRSGWWLFISLVHRPISY